MTSIVTLKELYNINESDYLNVIVISIMDEPISNDDLIKISKLKNVDTLILIKNNIFELPDCICELTKLKTMKININYLTKLPNSIDKLINLEQLNLNMNKILVMQPEIFNLHNLWSLDMTNNCLTSIPADIIKLNDNLRMLWIGNIDHSKIIKYEQHDNIIGLDITDYDDDDGNNNVVTLPSEFAEMHWLINFYCNTLKIDCVFHGEFAIIFNYNDDVIIPDNVKQINYVQHSTEIGLNKYNTILENLSNNVEHIYISNLKKNINILNLPLSLKTLSIYNPPYAKMHVPYSCWNQVLTKDDLSNIKLPFDCELYINDEKIA